MLSSHTLLVAIHVIANLVWIGAIASVGLVLSHSSGTSVERGQIARALYLRLAVPAFLASFATGLVRLLLSLEGYFVLTRYMHAKLLFAVAAIALHHVIGARARAMAKGSKTSPGPAAALSWLVVFSAAAAAFFAVIKPF